MSQPVVLILGAGPGVGANAAALFEAEGYRIALVSRSRNTHRVDDKHLEIQFDLSNTKRVAGGFLKVVDEFGEPPSVVIYISAARKVVPVDDPLSALPIGVVEADLKANLLSAIAAAQEAVKGFKQLPATASWTFIYTGNKLSHMSNPQVMFFGIGKTGAAKMIWDAGTAYRAQGFKFYYVDERWESGEAPREEMGPAAVAKVQLALAKCTEQGPWHHTFVAAEGSGRVDFSTTDNPWRVDGHIEQ